MTDARETNWEYIVGEPTGTFYTAQKKWITKVRRWKATHPDDVDIKTENPDGSLVVHLPHDWFKLSPKKVISEAQREASRDRLAKMHRDGLM